MSPVLEMHAAWAYIHEGAQKDSHGKLQPKPKRTAFITFWLALKVS